MAKICFVTYEIHPVTTGGCGVLLYNAAQVLLSQGHQVIFLLDTPRRFFDRFDTGVYPNPENCTAYHLDELCADIPRHAHEFGSVILHKAYRFHWAAQKVYQREKPDIIEFFDYNGIAHYACAAKAGLGAYSGSRLTVRLHNSDQLMNSHQPLYDLDHEFYMIYALEKSALKLSETVLYPSQGYLDDCYRPHPETWLGQKVLSRPPLLDHPRPGSGEPRRDAVLFYGRLFGFKGVDLLVDAAVSLLSRGEMAGARFVLVGYDSRQPPDDSPDYREYLLKRIPAGLRERFEFPGQMSWKQLGEMLPQVACAVIPSYLESFCYAAQELYEAGIPLLVSDIPVFNDYFSHERNALVFDGTASHLADSLKRLWDDPGLRQSLCRPFCVTGDPLGAFYSGPHTPSWLNPERLALASGEILVVVLDDGRGGLETTLASLAGQNGINQRVVVLRALEKDTDGEAGAVNFLGRLRLARDTAGNPLPAGDLVSGDYLLVLRAGDEVLEGYLASALGVLGGQPQLSWVSAWKWLRGPLGEALDTYPLDACLELIPWSGKPLLSRAVARTPAGRLIGDLMDPRLMEMGEVGHLWRLENGRGPGLVIPRGLLRVSREPAPVINSKLLSYLVMHDEDPERKRRLGNFLVARDRPRPGPPPPENEHRLIREAPAGPSRGLGRKLWGPILYDFCERLRADLEREPAGALLLHMPRRGLRLGYLFGLFLRRSGREAPCAQARLALSGAELAGACLARAPGRAAEMLLEQTPAATLAGLLAALPGMPPDAAGPAPDDHEVLGLPPDRASLLALFEGTGRTARRLRAWQRQQAARLDRALLGDHGPPRRVILLHPEPLTGTAALLSACLPEIDWSCRHLADQDPGGRDLGLRQVLAGPLAVPPTLVEALGRDQDMEDSGPWPPPPGRTHVASGLDDPFLLGIVEFFLEADPAWDSAEAAQRAGRARRALIRSLQYPRLEEVEHLARWRQTAGPAVPAVLPPGGGFGLAAKLRRIRRVAWPQGQAALEFPRFRWLLQYMHKALKIP
jgi:glycosyltransferase involved in cell wall biosynthesis